MDRVYEVRVLLFCCGGCAQSHETLRSVVTVSASAESTGGNKGGNNTGQTTKYEKTDKF